MGSLSIRDGSVNEVLIPFGKVQEGEFFYFAGSLYVKTSAKGARSIASWKLISVGENTKVVDVNVSIWYELSMHRGSEEYGGA